MRLLLPFQHFHLTWSLTSADYNCRRKSILHRSVDNKFRRKTHEKKTHVATLQSICDTIYFNRTASFHCSIKYLYDQWGNCVPCYQLMHQKPETCVPFFQSVQTDPSENRWSGCSLPAKGNAVGGVCWARTSLRVYTGVNAPVVQEQYNLAGSLLVLTNVHNGSWLTRSLHYQPEV